jgi:hypothetical protein
MNEIKELLQIIEKGGIIAILISIIYYGQKQIDKLDTSIKNQLIELSQSFKDMQKETNEVIKESIKVIARNNNLEPKIQQILDTFKEAVFRAGKEQ